MINLFVCLCGLTFPQGRLHREKKTKRKKENVLNQNLLGSASRRATTERRKTKKTFFVFMRNWPSPRVDYTERRKLKKNFFVFFAQKRFSLIFFLSVEVLLEADPNDFWLKTFSFFSLCLSSLCVFYPRGRSDCTKSQNKVFLSLSFLCGSSPWGRSYTISIWDILCFVLLVFSLSV